MIATLACVLSITALVVSAAGYFRLKRRVERSLRDLAVCLPEIVAQHNRRRG